MTTNPNASPLLALADRCEAASGPDRELDCLIMDALERWPDGWVRQESKVWGEGGPVFYHHPGGQPEWRVADSFTASIDAALTLVPEGWRRDIMDADNSDGLCRLETEDDREIHTRGKTWALALCAAALRAQASETGRG